jgi:hypothetical protein
MNKETQRVVNSWHTRDPIMEARHPQVLYLNPDREVSFTPLHVGWHLTIRVFLGMLHETTSPDLHRGSINPCLVLWRGICTC